ncbi:MAG: ribonuclease Z [Methanoregula sp.]|uniref:ribonuclease Z n=1 Tax=Methanoregula sp. TaxID=2052170 RepID=UPI003C5E88B3
MSGETLQVYFLGTAGALPTPMRNPSCIMVRRGTDMLLFDCGEGAQQQMMRARCGFTVNAIFVTHWHADHFLGIFGLVQTLSFNGRTEPLTIYGPNWVHEFVENLKKITRFNLKFPLDSIELRDGSWVRFNGYTVTGFAVSHGLPALGYVLEEDPRPGRFDRDHAIELGVPPGPLFGRLQRGETILVVKDGVEREVQPYEVMGAPRPGRKIVYTGDTKPVIPILVEHGRDADLLIHDATYDESEIKRAAEFYHATASQAGQAAAAANARILALTHISSRYTDTAIHANEAKAAFSGTIIVPDDLFMLEITYGS